MNKKGSEGRRTEWKLESFSKWMVFREMEGDGGTGFLFLVSHFVSLSKAQVVFQRVIVLYLSGSNQAKMTHTYRYIQITKK